MIFKLSFIVLAFTLPLLSGTPIYGIPQWVIGSFAATVAYAIMILLTIEFQWDDLKKHHDE